MRVRHALITAVLALGALAPGQGFRPTPGYPQAPRLLSQSGLYAEAGSSRIDPANMAYSPQYPLWSDGAGKSRWVFLPKGKTIDVRNPDAWVFPVGTKFWKEFSFNGKKVETRLLWRASEAAWVYAAYAWRPDQSDAELVENAGRKETSDIAPGISHAIPSIQDCKSCHENPSTNILGFNALQLSQDRDPNAVHAEPLLPHMPTLRTLLEQKLIRPLRPEFSTSPPRIQAADPRTRAALGYLSTNCGICHQTASPIANISLDLRYPYGIPDAGSAPGLKSTLEKLTRSKIPGHEGETRAISPGHPEASLILHRMASRRPISQMPPIGSALVDTEALTLLRSWVESALTPDKKDGASVDKRK